MPLPQGADGRMSHLRRGWYWGRQQFAEWALEFADALIRKGSLVPTREAASGSPTGQRRPRNS